jgi:hypothetical protein
LVEHRPLRAPPEEVAVLLEGVAHVRSLGERVGIVSGCFLGRPYLTEPLVGSPTEPEQLVTRLDAFDCVTFTEAALALASARVPDDFERELVGIRYHRGRVEWLHRNHYTSDWFERNVEAGRLTWVLANQRVRVVRSLSVLAGYPVRERTVRWLPVEHADALERAGRTGDIVGFGTSREDLDTSHVGLLVHGEGELLVRHASRSAGRVVQDPLAAYLAVHEPPGLLVARPVEHGVAT